MPCSKGSSGLENIRYEEAQSGGSWDQAGDYLESLAGAAALHFKRAVRYSASLSESCSTSSGTMRCRLGWVPDQDGHAARKWIC